MKPFKSFLDFIKSNPVSNHSTRVIRDWSNKPKYKGSVYPSVMTYGAQSLNSQSAMQTAVVTNVGTFALPIESIIGSGDWVISHNCPAVLQPGHSCMVAAVFNPRRAGLHTGGIYVNTGDAAGTEFVQLIGVGSGEVAPPVNTTTLSISDAVISSIGSAILTTYPSGTTAETAYTFSTPVPVEQDATTSFRLLATGTVSYTVLPASVGAFFITYGEPGTPVTAPASITDGQSLRVNVRYAPSAIGSNNNTLTLTSNGGTNTIALSGTAIAAVNNPPVIVGLPSTAQTVVTGISAQLVNFTITDGSTDTLTVTLTPVNGTIGGLVDADLVAAGIQLTGTASVINAALAAATFTATALGAASIGISVVDTANPAVTGTYSMTAVEFIALSPVTISGNQFMKDGAPFRIEAVNWAGFQSPTMCVHGLWRRGWKSMMADLVSMGFNAIRLPFSREGFEQVRTPTDLGALGVGQGPGATDLNPDWMGKTNFELLTMFINECTKNGLYVILDHHCNNYDTLDGTPVTGYWTEAGWLTMWGEMATRYGANTTIIGADLYNEPHATPWSTLRTLFQNCGNHIHTIAPNWLIFCGGGQDQTNTFWYGGNLEQVATLPVNLTLPNKVAYTPHEYGHSVGGQSWLATTGNTPANWPLNLNTKRRSVWSYIFENGIAPVMVGEFGGKFGWNNNGTASGDANAPFERVWLRNLIDHMNGDFDGDGDYELTGNQVGMSYAYWTFNANSGDTGGLLYEDATWTTKFQQKLDLLEPLFNPQPTVVDDPLRVSITGNQFIKNGQPFRLKSINWFGAELPDKIPHAMWGRNWKSMIAEMASMGFNSIRLPFSRQGFANMNTLPEQNNLTWLNSDLLGLTVYEVFDAIIAECALHDMYVILDHHRNDWDTQDGTPIRVGYDQAGWHALWGQMATRYGNNPRVIGADMYNEPIATTWTQFATWVEACANHIHTIAPNWIIFVQGADRDPALNGGDNLFWAGGNLEAVRTRPITLTLPNKVAYAPHEYAHSVYASDWLAREGFTAPANWPLNQHAKRSYHYGFIFEQGIAPIWVGEFGGMLGYTSTAPNTSDGTVNGGYERQWLTTLINHMNGDFDGNGTTNLVSPSYGMSFAYWSYNANSSDTGGLLIDDWSAIHTGRRGLLNPLMDFAGVGIGAPPPITQVPPVMGNVPNQSATIGTAFNLTLASYVTLTNSDAVTTYTLTGTLPAGISFNNTTGVFSGTPTTEVTANLSVTATDNDGASNSDSFTITVQAAAPVLTAPTNLNATVAGNLDITYTWDADSSVDFLLEVTDVSNQTAITTVTLSTNSYLFTLAAQTAHYGSQTYWADFTVNKVNRTTLANGPTTRYNGALN